MSIWEAVEREDLDAIEAYVRNGGDLDVGATRLGKTPLLHALILKKEKSYEKLLALGANPNTICRGGGEITLRNCSVVHHASLRENPSWLRVALESGGDANQMSEGEGLQKGRPLYFAIAEKGHLENVKLLCEHGADVDAPVDRLGRTALYQAAEQRTFGIVYYLLERGADIAEPRPLAQHLTFIDNMRRAKPDLFEMRPEIQKQCAAVWDWLKKHGKDPDKAKWNGSKWTWENE